MTAVCPSESSPEGAEAAARTAEPRGSGGKSTAASISASAAEPVDSIGDSVQASVVVPSVQRFNRWSHQDSLDINTDDEGTSVRRLTPLERLNLDMCQDERCEGAGWSRWMRFVLDLISRLSCDHRVVRELTVGRRIGFYKIRGEIGCGNFSHVKLGIHALTKGKKIRDYWFRLTIISVKREGIKNQTMTSVCPHLALWLFPLTGS